MAIAWFQNVWQSAFNVSKTAIHNAARDNVAAVYTYSEFAALTSGGIRAAIVGGRVYVYDATDTTTADNGDTCIVSADGLRYKRLAPFGDGINVLDVLADTGELPVSGDPGDAYVIDGDLWIWTGAAFEDAGPFSGRSIASQGQAQAGTNNTTDMSPLRTLEAIKYRAPMGHAALKLLNGEEGLGLDFLARSAAIRDFANTKNFIGTPDELLTVSRASTAAYIDRDRLIKYAAINALRYDHDPVSGAPLGVLIEGSRTNLLTRSEEADNAAWTKTNCTISANAVSAPDGATTADKIVEANDVGQTHNTQHSPSFTSGSIYTYSVFLKAAERSRVIILLATAAFGANVQGDFTLSGNGTATIVLAGTSTSVRITAMANGWYRCEVTSQATATSAAAIQIRLHNGTSVAYNGDGTSGLYVWGAQLEVGAFASSYIPTTSATVTRSADAVSLALSAVPFDATQGTLFAESQILQTATSTRIVAGLDDGGTDERIQIAHQNADALAGLMVDGGVSQASLAVGGAGVVKRRSALTWRANDVAFSFDGAAATTDTSATLPTVTTLSIGDIGAGSSVLFGYVRKLGLLSRRVTNTELTSLAA